MSAPRLGLLLVPRHLWLCAEPRTPRLQQMARCSVLFFFDNSGMVTDGSEEHFPSVLQNTSTGAQVLISPNPRACSPGTPGYGVTVQPRRRRTRCRAHCPYRGWREATLQIPGRGQTQRALSLPSRGPDRGPLPPGRSPFATGGTSPPFLPSGVGLRKPRPLPEQ